MQCMDSTEHSVLNEMNQVRQTIATQSHIRNKKTTEPRETDGIIVVMKVKGLRVQGYDDQYLHFDRGVRP